MQIQELLLKAITSQTYPEEFLRKINPAGKLSPESALKVYLQGYIARLTESLGEKYEAVWAVLGDEKYFEISKEYIHQNPTNIFNINNYGDSFPDFLKVHPIIQDFPFLEDLANFEKYFFEVFHWSSEESLDLSKVVLSDNDFYINFIRLSLMNSNFSIFKIWEDRKDLNEVTRYDWEESEWLILFKRHSKVFIQKFDSLEWELINLLYNGNSFYSSIDKMGDKIDEHFVTNFFKTIGGMGIIKNIEELH